MPAMTDIENFADIKVVGIGGGGCNAVNRMVQEKIRGVQFISVNTDAQALVRSEAPLRIRIGDKITRGLGTGGDPHKGMQAAQESQGELMEALQGADMVFLTAGMGGGTGTGATSVVAEVAKETGALTIGVVTKPFTFEGTERRRVAEEGITDLRDKVDSLIVIPNDRLLSLCDASIPLVSAFKVADDVLRQGIQGISELITVPGEINRDFADVKAIMGQAGPALMAIGRGSGEKRAEDAAKAAISSPLLDVSIEGATGVLFNITGGENLSLHEVHEAAELIAQAVDPNARIYFGTVIDPKMDNEVKITIIATGFRAAMAGIMGDESKVRPLKLSPLEESEDVVIPSFLRRAGVVR